MKCISAHGPRQCLVSRLAKPPPWLSSHTPGYFTDTVVGRIHIMQVVPKLLAATQKGAIDVLSATARRVGAAAAAAEDDRGGDSENGNVGTTANRPLVVAAHVQRPHSSTAPSMSECTGGERTLPPSEPHACPCEHQPSDAADEVVQVAVMIEMGDNDVLLDLRRADTGASKKQADEGIAPHEDVTLMGHEARPDVGEKGEESESK